jgi:predicted RNA binding protein YcfA (HicA-like mRNA interferase family)
MKESSINSLYDALPQVFIKQRHRLPDNVILREGSVAGSEITGVEEALLPDAMWPDSNLDNSEVLRRPLGPDVSQGTMIPAGNDLLGSHDEEGRLREPWGDPSPDGAYPGCPQPYAPNKPPPIDALAFYLPFHRFATRCYGIYIFADGLAWMAKVLYQSACGYLSPREALILGKAYLYHHEAYHNAVEVFATRLELAHRQPIYEAGASIWFKTAVGREHEEALATGYAVKNASASLPTKKRRFAKELLRQVTSFLPPPYCDGVHVVDPKSHTRSQQVLQEESCNRSVRGLPNIASVAWDAGPHLMHPSLSRGKRFSYVIHKGSRLANRLPLGAIYFADRRKLMKKLKEHLGGGREEAGGKHPIFRAPHGKRVPIPYTKDVDEGTLGSILDALEIDMRPREFMRLQRY